jgi:hypothetical protein
MGESFECLLRFQGLFSGVGLLQMHKAEATGIVVG